LSIPTQNLEMFGTLHILRMVFSTHILRSHKIAKNYSSWQSKSVCKAIFSR